MDNMITEKQTKEALHRTSFMRCSGIVKIMSGNRILISAFLMWGMEGWNFLEWWETSESWLECVQDGHFPPESHVEIRPQVMVVAAGVFGVWCFYEDSEILQPFCPLYLMRKGCHRWTGRVLGFSLLLSSILECDLTGLQDYLRNILFINHSLRYFCYIVFSTPKTGRHLQVKPQQNCII